MACKYYEKLVFTDNGGEGRCVCYFKCVYPQVYLCVHVFICGFFKKVPHLFVFVLLYLFICIYVCVYVCIAVCVCVYLKFQISDLLIHE